MTDASLPASQLPSAGQNAKRRKVRKGTQSCWECKRRKIKCTFALTQDVTCNGCRRRGTPCVSQEFPEYAAGHVGDRLGRVEALVEQLIKNAGTSPLRSSTGNNPYHDGEVPTAGNTPSGPTAPNPLSELVRVASILSPTSPSNITIA